MSDGADILDLSAARRDRAPVHIDRSTRAPRQPAGCQHDQPKVDMKNRRLVCTECGELVDPFLYLQRLGETWDRHERNREAAAAAAKQAELRLADLRAEERRISGRLGRMRDQEATLKHRIDLLDAELRAFTPDPQPDRRH